MCTGKRMKERRKSLGIKAEEVAEALNCSRSTIFRYESGDIEKVPATLIDPIAEILQTTVGYLMGWTDDPDIGNIPEMDSDGNLCLNDSQKKYIGKKLASKRKSRKIDIAALSNMTGISSQKILMYEDGIEKDFSLEDLKIIAKSLNSTVSYFTSQLWDSVSMDLSDIEASMVRAYRDNPDKQHPVNKFLGVWDNPPEHEDDPTIELQKTVFWEKYFSLDERGRKMVDMVLEQEYAHSNEIEKQKINSK